MPIDPESRKEFFAALGQLIATWADVELELYRVLIHYTKVSDGTGRVLFSGTRARQAVAFLGGLIHNGEITDQHRIDDLKHLFQQIGIINSKRDELAHHLSDSSYGVDPARPEGRAYTNAYKVTRYGNELIWFIEIKDIEAMIYDLHGIANHLRRHYGRNQQNGFTPWREDPANDAPTPWLYKSLPPERMAGR